MNTFGDNYWFYLPIILNLISIIYYFSKIRFNGKLNYQTFVFSLAILALSGQFLRHFIYLNFHIIFFFESLLTGFLLGCLFVDIFKTSKK